MIGTLLQLHQWSVAYRHIFLTDISWLVRPIATLLLSNKRRGVYFYAFDGGHGSQDNRWSSIR